MRRRDEVVALGVHVNEEPDGFSYQVPLSDGSRYVSVPFPTRNKAFAMGRERAASRLWVPVLRRGV